MSDKNSTAPISLNELPESKISYFWSRVSKKSDSECWQWTGEHTSLGYGRVSIGSAKTRRRIVATRVSYFLHYGIDPKEKFVCHKCDNPPCVNPLHLFLGTSKQNMQDAKRKNRTLKGARHPRPNAVISPEIVREIRSRKAQGEHVDKIADRFNVSVSSVYKVCGNLRWQHIN